MKGWANMPDHARAALEHLRAKFTNKPREGEIDLTWAHAIMAKKERGETVSQAALEMAREALARNGVRR